VQCVDTAIVGSHDARAAIEQAARDLVVRAQHGDLQRRHATLVGGVDIARSIGEQCVNNVDVSLCDGGVQRRGTSVVARVDGGTECDQVLDNARTAVACCYVQWLLARRCAVMIMLTCTSS
jgi:hypothetical protein